MLPIYPIKLYGIVGHPVAQSLSPVLHNWGFTHHKIPAIYMAWDKKSLELPDFVAAMRSLPISGASVTIPGKEVIMPLVDRVTVAAKAIGAVNTLYWEGDSLVGANTDLDGFLFPLGGRTPPAALVLGGGGAARAVLAGLSQLGTKKITIAVRNPAKAAQLAQDFCCQLVPWEERVQALQNMGQGLVVNVTPLGMYEDFEDKSPIPEDAWPAPLPTNGYFMAYDIVYNPRHTRFLHAAQAKGWQTLDGLGFFVAQAFSQFRLWTGQVLPFEKAQAVVEEALKARWNKSQE